ncbi:HAD hydrolase-like protein [Bifidobacterium canis]|uniref:Hydrolase or phosphatase n=1 Tax=Bifidobacterium canis TaxID=2610880 RepID=A0A7K1J6T4_9BIFI|nr:HAD hydrolase-like protein [Bifidobacterium canis]MUH60175.1 hydrolase or phosphatase [Bifidobacterium canis]
MTQSAKKIVLLDLDGTLTESGPGIIACVVKAFQAVGVPVPDEAALQRFIGPAIVDSMKLNHIPPEKLDEAVRVYRHYYGEAAVFDDPNYPGQKVPGRFVNSMYEGIPQQLRKMRDMGFYLAVCTAKPEYQAIPICEHFRLSDLVDGIYGASKDNSRITKAAVITYALDKIGFDEAAGDKALMVGDRWTDVDGAKDNGLDCLGCGWGYAEPNELREHGAVRVIPFVSELAEAVDEYFNAQ